ncbi:hypothetical protein D1872_264980 [compost metagenome]
MIANADEQSGLGRTDPNLNIPVFGDFDFFGSLDGVIQHVPQHHAQVVPFDAKVRGIKPELRVDSDTIGLPDVEGVGYQRVDGQIAGVYPVVGIFNLV